MKIKAEIVGGPLKRIYEDDDGKDHVETVPLDFGVKLIFYTLESDVEPLENSSSGESIPPRTAVFSDNDSVSQARSNFQKVHVDEQELKSIQFNLRFLPVALFALLAFIGFLSVVFPVCFIAFPLIIVWAENWRRSAMRKLSSVGQDVSGEKPYYQRWWTIAPIVIAILLALMAHRG